MGDSTQPHQRWASSGWMTWRILVAGALTATALTFSALSSGGTAPIGAAVPEPAIGLSLPIVTPPATPPSAEAQATTALATGVGQHSFLDVLNNKGGPDFLAVPDANLTDLVFAVCADLLGGNSVAQTLQDTQFLAVVDNPTWVLTDGDIGFVVGAADRCCARGSLPLSSGGPTPTLHR
jgi:hypothetical protein